MLHGCLQFMSLDVRLSPLMNANPTINNPVFTIHAKSPVFWLYIFDIKIIMGLRQTFMTLMQWAIDVPHKQ